MVQNSKDGASKTDSLLEIRLIFSCLTLVARSLSLKRWSFIGFNNPFRNFALGLILFDHFFAALDLLVLYLHLRKAFFFVSGEYIIDILFFVSDKDTVLIDSLRKFDLLLASRLFELSGLTIISRLKEA